MKFFSFSKKRKKARLIFDIKSESISASLIYLAENARPEVAYSERIFFYEEEDVNTKRYLSKFFNALKQVSKSASDFIKKAKVQFHQIDIEGVNYILSSPWVISQSKNVIVRKDKAFSIDSKLLESILIDEGKKIEETKEKEISTKKKAVDLNMIEEKVIQTKLNGYKVNSIFGRKAREIELNFLLSFSDNDLLEKIKSISSESFGNIKTYIHSFTLASFSTIRDLFPKKDDFLILDIGGEVSDICLCEDENAKNIFSIPLGKNKIIREVAKDLGVSFTVAQSLINIRCKGHCHDKTDKQISESLNTVLESWLANISSTLSKLSPSGDIPREIFVFVDDEISQTIAMYLKKDRLQKFKIINHDFNIIVLDDNKLNNFINKGKTTADDSHLKTCVMFLGKLNRIIK